MICTLCKIPSSSALIVSAFSTRIVKLVKLAQSCPTLCNPMDSPRNSLGQNTGVGSLSLLQGIFPTQRSNPGLLHCGRILYQLGHKGSPYRPLQSTECSSLCYTVQFSCSVTSDSLQPHGLQHTRLPCPSPAPRVCSNSCPSSW